MRMILQVAIKSPQISFATALALRSKVAVSVASVEAVAPLAATVTSAFGIHLFNTVTEGNDQ